MHICLQQYAGPSWILPLPHALSLNQTNTVTWANKLSGKKCNEDRNGQANDDEKNQPAGLNQHYGSGNRQLNKLGLQIG